MSMGATTIRSPGPGEASANMRPSKSRICMCRATPEWRKAFQTFALVCGDDLSMVSSARQRLTTVHRAIGWVAPHGSM